MRKIFFALFGASLYIVYSPILKNVTFKQVGLHILCVNWICYKMLITVPTFLRYTCFSNFVRVYCWKIVAFFDHAGLRRHWSTYYTTRTRPSICFTETKHQHLLYINIVADPEQLFVARRILIATNGNCDLSSLLDLKQSHWISFYLVLHM